MLALQGPSGRSIASPGGVLGRPWAIALWTPCVLANARSAAPDYSRLKPALEAMYPWPVGACTQRMPVRLEVQRTLPTRRESPYLRVRTPPLGGFEFWSNTLTLPCWLTLACRRRERTVQSAPKRLSSWQAML